MYKKISEIDQIIDETTYSTLEKLDFNFHH